MVRVGNVIVITLGTPSGATGTVTTATTATWTPSATSYGAGNAALTTSASEIGPADVQF